MRMDFRLLIFSRTCTLTGISLECSLFSEMGSHCVAQAGLKPLGSHHPPASASQQQADIYIIQTWFQIMKSQNLTLSPRLEYSGLISVTAISASLVQAFPLRQLPK
ncbi:hypothetical protein AAY473_017052 [Plecturocebus cupreus]